MYKARFSPHLPLEGIRMDPLAMKMWATHYPQCRPLGPPLSTSKIVCKLFCHDFLSLLVGYENIFHFERAGLTN
jgi:hypothetical protein